MIWHQRARVLHRWLSMTFTLCVVANFAVMPLGNEALGMAVGGLTLIPLLLLMATGLYLFALPYWGPAADRSTADRAEPPSD